MRFGEALDRSASSAEMYDVVARHGLCVIQGFASAVDGLRQAALDLLQKRGTEGYRFGRGVRCSPDDLRAESPTLLEVLGDARVSRCAMQCGLPRAGDVFITHEYRSYRDVGLEANGYLHFDRMHTLTALLYLTDADASSGALSYVPESRVLGRQWRREHPSVNRIARADTAQGSQESSNYRELAGWEHLLEQVVAVEGEAGTLILFDNDTLHYGGRVERGRRRLIARIGFQA